ncbi:ATP-dependent RNA helicase DDX31-like [Homarus americanus]|uniref:ATP-dependent RNA helicase n=1 Tax=Homarus americanus TaxID=6706 RepID=A0A8J5K472_HOMAM|nr:ATP-dependent RNA helicase DDX31-like [Homarus americanus]
MSGAGLTLNIREGDNPNWDFFRDHRKRGRENHSGDSSAKRLRDNPLKGKERDDTRHSSTRKVVSADNGTAEEEQDNTFEEKREILTSLFTGNPDIPYILQSNISKMSEKVFSEDSFSSLKIAPQIISNVEKLGFTSMTMVQQKSIPAVLAGKDTLIKSQTGSGKTLTYALPIIHSLMMQTPHLQRSDGVLAVVIVPTRELALQSYQWFEKLCKSCVWVVPGYLIGGEKKKAEKSRLRKGINILVATPGRLIDHLYHTKSLSVANVKYLVIDEADRLLDMGYERSVTSIIETLTEQQPGLSRSRQTIMLSATLSAGVEKLAGMSLLSPEVVDISHEGEESSSQLTSEDLATPENLTHHYVLVPAKLRLVTLAAFILSKCKFGDERKMVVFFATQDMVDYHTALFSKILSRYGKTTNNNSSLARRAEKDRSSVFNSFREATAGVLMCTDVASRGLDMPKVRWIVQFNAACTAADYVHRVGRTARVNAAGLKEVLMQKVLKNLMLPVDNASYRPLTQSYEEAATSLQVQVEKLLLRDHALHMVAKKAYVSFVRSYASYPKEVREMFNFKALHLGHYAKSMGLRDTPAALGASAAFKAKREMKEKRERKENRKRIRVMNQRCGNLPKTASMSEFDSGLEGLSKMVRKKGLVKNKARFKR